MKKIIKGAIFYANLDPIIGSEQGGLRPVLIIQNNIGNKYSPTTIIAPITKNIWKCSYLPTHIKIKHYRHSIHNSIIMLEQVRTIDKLRLQNYVTMLNFKQMKAVELALVNSFGIKNLKKVKCVK